MKFIEIKEILEEILSKQIGKSFIAYQLCCIIQKKHPEIWQRLQEENNGKDQTIPLFIANAMSYFTRNNTIPGLKQSELCPKYLNIKQYEANSSAKFVGAWQIVRDIQPNQATISNLFDYIKIASDIKERKGDWSYAISSKEKKDSEYITSIKRKKQSIKNIKNYIDTLIMVENLNSESNDGKPSNIFLFRGQSKCSYKLLPSVFREPHSSNESYYLKEVTTSKPDSFLGKSKLDTLTTMQHYGCPTRLLDVTTNPLIALYFACASNQDEDGEVYIFSTNKNNLCYPESDKVSILANLAIMTDNEKKEIFNEACNSLNNQSFNISKNNQYQNKSLEKLFVKIRTEKPGFKREITPIDLLRPIVVKAAKSNPRIQKQDGLFILSGLSETTKEAEFKLNLLSPFTIKISNKEMLLKELDNLGINKASLFPDLEHISTYLKEQNEND